MRVFPIESNYKQYIFAMCYKNKGTPNYVESFRKVKRYVIKYM